MKPQREDERVLIDVPAGKADAAQTLQIVYAAPVGAVALCGTVDMLAPKLLLRAEHGKEAVELPLADLVWRLHQPDGYEVVRAGGTVVTDDIRRPLPAAVEVAGILYYLTGGFSGPLPFMPAVQAAREAGRRSPLAGSSLVANAPPPAAERPATPAFEPPPPAERRPIDLTRPAAAERKIEAALDSPAQIGVRRYAVGPT